MSASRRQLWAINTRIWQANRTHINHPFQIFKPLPSVVSSFHKALVRL